MNKHIYNIIFINYQLSQLTEIFRYYISRNIPKLYIVFLNTDITKIMKGLIDVFYIYQVDIINSICHNTLVALLIEI
ncbi:hypothetical protein GCM10025879_12640 [Leuconostoc litchii]|nr:hypothetical protein GCM10025879_12640 [Leuconostoc litchii]